MTHVWVLDAWDDMDLKATTRVFSSKEDAKRAMSRYLSLDRKHCWSRTAEVVKRKVR